MAQICLHGTASTTFLILEAYKNFQESWASRFLNVLAIGTDCTTRPIIESLLEISGKERLPSAPANFGNGLFPPSFLLSGEWIMSLLSFFYL